MKNRKFVFTEKLILMIFFISVIIIQVVNNLYAGFSQEAEEYRRKGYEALAKNDLSNALVYYQKTINLEPYYAEAHNDLGIVYEKMGWLNKAEQSYRAAIKIQPDFVPAYTNLALLCERRGDIKNAVVYYKARYSLGSPKDSWTKKARDKLLIYAPKEVKKAQANELLDEVMKEMKIPEQQMKEIAKRRFKQACELFAAGNLLEAINEIEIARKFAPEDAEINLLERKIKSPVIKEYFTRAFDYFQEGSYNQSRKYFADILTLIPRKEKNKEKVENK